jgi:hypothetical protein
MCLFLFYVLMVLLMLLAGDHVVCLQLSRLPVPQHLPRTTFRIVIPS